jgi:proteasome lid subunit RPN8/RPN11
MPLSFQELPETLQSEFLNHYQSVAPREAIGLLLSDGTSIRLRNWSRRQDRFLVGWWSILWNLGWRTLRYGEGIDAVYHSHVGSCEPGPTDRTFMVVLARRWPEVSHLIFVPHHEYGIWHYVGGNEFSLSN